MFSTFSTVGLIANAVAFAMAGAIVEAFGPRAVFALGAVVSAACVPLLRRMCRERTHRDGPAATDSPVDDVHPPA
jgi:MFS family permease